MYLHIKLIIKEFHLVVHSVGVTVCRQAECILFSMQFNHKQQDKTEYKLNTQTAQN